MICPECKKEISDSAKFCRFCGTKIEIIKVPQSDSNTRNCPFCGKSVKHTAKFCRFCGGNLKLYDEDLLKKAAEEVKIPEESVTEKELGIFEEPVIEEEAKATEEPVIEEKPEATEEPVIEEEPEAAEEPVIEEEPAAEEKMETAKEQYEPAAGRRIVFADEAVGEKKKSVDIDESIFEEDREFLYEGFQIENSKVPLWGIPAVNADKLAGLEETYKKNTEKDFEPYYRSLKPIAFSAKDTTPEPIFNSTLGNYALKREPEPVKETKAAVRETDEENRDVVNYDKQQVVSKIIDDSRKEVLSQKINGDNSGYVILAFLSALLLFTAIVVGFTKFVLPKLSTEAYRNNETCVIEIADLGFDEDIILSDLLNEI